MLLKQKSKGGTFVNYKAYFLELSNTHCFKRSNTNNGKTDQVRLAESRATIRECIFQECIILCARSSHILYACYSTMNND